MLLRPKRGISSEQRFKDFGKNQVFDRIRNKNPDLLNKLRFISGDINQNNLGLNDNDCKILTENVDIVFHVAATVRFNETLREAANLNTFGTRRVMELCSKMKNLRVIMK
jgi:fatty acyl-CoA reductase